MAMKCKNPRLRLVSKMKRRTCDVCGESIRSFDLKRDSHMMSTMGGVMTVLPGPVSVEYECVRGHTWSEPAEAW